MYVPTTVVFLSKGLAYAEIFPQVDSGFLEAIVKGYKAGILTQNHYANLTQCETLEGWPNFEIFNGIHSD